MPESETTDPTDAEFRAAGFTGEARKFPRDEVAKRLLCAFVGIDRNQMPAAWGYHPNDSTRKAWMRVADEARAIFGEDVSRG